MFLKTKKLKLYFYDSISYRNVGSSSDQAFFLVTEKEDILGQIFIPVTSLSGPPGKTFQSILQPHKKCANPCGELIYQCYISYRRPIDVIQNHRSPVLSLKSKKGGRRGSTLSAFNKKISRSIHDLLGFNGKESGDESDQGSRSRSNSKNKIKYCSTNGLDSSGKLPFITRVTPNIGLIAGGTRICIEGQNLGYSKSDIVDLTVCESDLADYIEYESQTRIYVTTRKTLSGKGDVILETESGGLGSLHNAFTFVEKLPEEGGTNPFEDEPDALSEEPQKATGTNPFEDEVDEDMQKVLEECRTSPTTPIKKLPPVCLT